MTEQLELGADLRDEALARVEEASDDWSRSVIDQALSAVADRGSPFSANDVRPSPRRGPVGSRAAAGRGDIRKVGWVASTDPGTHAHPVAQWVAGTTNEGTESAA